MTLDSNSKYSKTTLLKLFVIVLLLFSIVFLTQEYLSSKKDTNYSKYKYVYSDNPIKDIDTKGAGSSPTPTTNNDSGSMNVKEIVYETSTVLSPKDGEWVRLTSSYTGISFDYPTDPDIYAYEFELIQPHSELSGGEFAWRGVHKGDTRTKYKSEVAHAVYDDFTAGRETGVTDVSDLIFENGNYYHGRVNSNTNTLTKKEIFPIKVFTTKFDTPAVLFNVTDYFVDVESGFAEGRKNDTALLIKLPNSVDVGFKAFLIYFYNGVSLENAQHVVDSFDIINTNK